MNYHSGPRLQRGHGIGSLLSGLFRGIAPVVRNIVRSPTVRKIGKQALNIARDSAIDIASDLIEGKTPAEAFNTQLESAQRDIASTLRSAKKKPGRKRKAQQSEDNEDGVSKKSFKMAYRKKHKDLFD